jgi:hypothetical protein
MNKKKRFKCSISIVVIIYSYVSYRLYKGINKINYKYKKKKKSLLIIDKKKTNISIDFTDNLEKKTVRITDLI